MFALITPYNYAIPEIDKGSGDLESLSSGVDALPNAAGQAPSLETCGTIYAEDYAGSGSWDVAEYLAIFPPSGQSPPALTADQRHPGAFVLKMRSTTTAFASLADFQSAVADYRQTRGSAVPCVEALGRRYADLQSDWSAAGFPNANQGVETRDLYAGSGTTPIGCAFLARTSNTTTTQHWVLFDSRPFDNIRSEIRAQSYANVAAFLSAMATLRSGSPVAFRHAVEQATHFGDVPW